MRFLLSLVRRWRLRGSETWVLPPGGRPTFSLKTGGYRLEPFAPRWRRLR